MQMNDAVLTIEERGLLLADAEKDLGLLTSLKSISGAEEALKDSEECLAMREAKVGEVLDTMKLICAFCGASHEWDEKPIHKEDCVVSVDEKMPEFLNRKELVKALTTAMLLQLDGKNIPKESRLSRKERALICATYLAILADISPMAYAKMRFLIEARGIS